MSKPERSSGGCLQSKNKLGGCHCTSEQGRDSCYEMERQEGRDVAYNKAHR